MLAEILGLLARMAVGAVRRAPHLSLFPVLFWGTVAAGLYLRYWRHQTTRSDRVLRATVLVGVVAVAVGALDLAVRLRQGERVEGKAVVNDQRVLLERGSRALRRVGIDLSSLVVGALEE